MNNPQYIPIMKHAIRILIAIVISSLNVPSLYSQDIDPERMNRDINITENILQEMFKTTSNAPGLHVSSGAFAFGAHNDISGTYLHEYGVIFTIPARRSVFVFATDDEDEAAAFSFQYGSGDTGKEVSRETIVTRISEFLREYGSTIGQLRNDDRITVIYGSNTSQRHAIVRAFAGTGKQVQEQSAELPSSIYVTARKSDLEAYKRGSISLDAFDDRLDITINEEDTERQDLKIMANILKTSFEESNSEAFRIRGDVNSIYIDDLGALFYLDSSYGSGFFELNAAVVKIREEIKKIERDDSSSVWVSRTPAPDRKSMASNGDRAAAYQTFLQQLKETLVDYGRTLKSVQPDEQVYVSVTLPGASDEVPERVDLQIRKSVLEQLDRGQTSRAQAISQVVVREY